MNSFTVSYRSTPDGRGNTDLKEITLDSHSAFGAAINARRHASDIDYIVSVH